MTKSQKNLDGILDYFAYKKTNESYKESTILYSYKKEIYRALKINYPINRICIKLAKFKSELSV